MNRLRKGDLVEIICGKDRGQRGKIIKIITKKNRAIVENLNLVYKHLKPNQDPLQPQGGIVKRPASIHLSNLMPVCTSCNKPVRVSYRVEGDDKIRVCRKCGRPIGA